MYVKDSWLNKELLVRVFLLFVNPDLRAVPHLNAQMTAPAINGACSQCEQQGTHLDPDKRTVYLGAYR